MTRVEVVGRAAELASIRSFLAERPAGPRALVLEGPPGIGKTTIVRAAVAEAESAGLRVLRVRPAAGEAELPYVGLGDLLAPLADDAFAALAHPQRAALDAALGRAGAAGAVEEAALSRGLLELLRREAGHDDLLLVIDDMQWLDRPTAAALTFAFRRLERDPLRLVAAIRTEEPLGEVPLALADWDGPGRLAVGPLQATELGVLVRERLGVQLARPALEELARMSDGNPMFALELATQRGTRVPTLVRAVENRIRVLAPSARTAVSVAGAALRPTTELLVRAGVTHDELRAAVDSGVVEVDGSRLSFSHPLLGAAAYELLLPHERHAIHLRLAAASADAVERGHHVARAASGGDPGAAGVLDHAADAAAARGDHAGAASFLLRAAELDPDGAVERELRASAELAFAGEAARACALARHLLETLPPGPMRARVCCAYSEFAFGLELGLEESLAQLDVALADAADDPALLAEVHLTISMDDLSACKLADAVAHARCAFELAERSGSVRVAVEALGLLGFGEGMLGLGVTDSARRAAEEWDGSPGWRTSPRMQLACTLIPLLAYDEAAALFGAEVAWAETYGLEPIEVTARAHLAELQVRAGHWADALANSERAYEHARQAANGQIVCGSAHGLAMVRALLGQLDAARELAGNALVTAERDGDFWFIVSHRGILGLIELTEDRPAAAVDVLEPAWELMLERELGDLSIFPIGQVLGEALVTIGRGDDALAIVERLRACPVGGQPWCRAMAARVEGLVCSARGDHAHARPAFANALAAHDDWPEPFEHARTLHLLGRVERSARNWGAARAAFADALERFDALGAARWSEKAQADLARLPGRRPATARELTMREREIAELVAAGLANKEVATRLYVSVRTVETNLSKVYAKLGVRSRTELAGKLRLSADG